MREKHYTGENVRDAAKRRIRTVFDEFESIIVSISGGKDSTVLAHLALIEAVERCRKIGLFFLDEEAVYQSTINQIKYLMGLYPENTHKLWYQIPFNLTNSTSYIEGQLHCWDPACPELWMREKEPYSIQCPEWDVASQTIRNKRKGFGFYDVLDNFQRAHPNTAQLIGLRADESLDRWRAITKNPAYNGIFWSSKPAGCNGTFNFYPIYDWTFSDVWKYLHENNVRYSRIYDYMHKKGMAMREMRVSSLVHEKSFKALAELPEFEPDTYNRLLRRISGIQVGNIYGHDEKMLQCRKLPKAFKSWSSYRDFLMATYPDAEARKVFEKRFARHLQNEAVARQQCKQLILNDLENNLAIENKPDKLEECVRFWGDAL